MVAFRPYEKFAAMIVRDWDGIVAAYCYPENIISFSLMEGLNNKIRIRQRRAYGYHGQGKGPITVECGLPDQFHSRKRLTIS